MTNDVVDRLTGQWWTFVLRGLIGVALAFFAFAIPATMASGLVFVVAAFFIVSALLAVTAGVSFTGIGSCWALILLGVVQAALGIIMLNQPGTGPLALAYLVAIWAISTGLAEVSSAIALRNFIKNEFWWVLLGIITLAFGMYVVLRPDLGVLALVYSIGIYAALAGGSLIGLGIRIKNAGRDVAKLRTKVVNAAEAALR
jgi:uncharacterized membrane protein HdeD (DUF308 family)